MPILHSLHRLLARQLRRPRSRGYGVQSPWAYRFLREVIMAREGDDRTTALEERLQHRCGTVRHLTADTADELLEQWLNEARPPEVLVAGDIHRSAIMRRRWRQLLKDSRVGVTFDCYDFGLAFFDRKMHKRTYKVNYTR